MPVDFWWVSHSLREQYDYNANTIKMRGSVCIKNILHYTYSRDGHFKQSYYLKVTGKSLKKSSE